MSQTEPDYTRSSTGDLLDVERHLDREAHPDRWERLQVELDKRRSEARRAGPSDEAFPRYRLIAGFQWWTAFYVLVALAGPNHDTRRMLVSLLVSGWGILAGYLLWRGDWRGRLAAIPFLLIQIPIVQLRGTAYGIMPGLVVLAGKFTTPDQRSGYMATFNFTAQVLLGDAIDPRLPGVLAVSVLPVVALAWLLIRVRPASALEA
ncbi:hypothetical protein [Singulisphaera sp. PoT]|uniref:hypothetical protein n=1 Tax=Singulisphaera sp. PoT TaxID=3411797 RepID=UPI003BF4C0E4